MIQYLAVLFGLLVLAITSIILLRRANTETRVIVNQEHSAVLVDGTYESVAITCRDACVTVITLTNSGTTSFGSAFFMRILGDVYLITAAHVIEDANSVTAVASNFNNTPGNHQFLKCSVLGLDLAADVGVLSLPTQPGLNQTVLQFYEGITEVPQGSACAVIGNPLGVDMSSLAEGRVRDGKYCEMGPESIHITAPILPGNSGSPILSVSNEPRVIGLVSWVYVDSDQMSQACFAGGVNTFILTGSVRRIVELESNFKNKGFMGITASRPHTYHQIGEAPPGGIEVLGVTPAGPFELGDIILKVAGQPVGVFDSQYSISRHTWFNHGKELTVEYRRGNSFLTDAVKLWELPANLDKFDFQGTKYKKPIANLRV